MYKIKTILTFTILLFTHIASAVEPKSVAYQPFPAGYGYMEKNEIHALASAVKKGDHKVVREHGWKLWAGIMQPANGMDWPLWYTWPNTHTAFAADSGLGLDAQAKQGTQTVVKRNTINTPLPVNESQTPVYPIPQQVKDKYPNATSKCGTGNICDGAHVAFNGSDGDIMIATESFSLEAQNWIRDPKLTLYKKESLNNFHSKGVHMLEAPQRHIVTKHMYWPVKAKGLTGIPVWHDDFKPDYTKYAGYENWKNLIAVDPSDTQIGTTQTVTYLYGVNMPDGKTPWPSVTAPAKVHGLKDFYYHKVSQADWDTFDEADKAIIDAASYWANNQPFAPGDYLVTIAMHINTKEIPSWTMQSVWWSDQPEHGSYSTDRPRLPNAKGPWAHYLLVDAYGITEKPSGNQPVASNPYIELVTHPVSTNCNTCHMRAGWPMGNSANQASYQNPDCPNLLATLTPNSLCLKSLTLTDFQWTIPDRAIK